MKYLFINLTTSTVTTGASFVRFRYHLGHMQALIDFACLCRWD